MNSESCYLRYREGDDDGLVDLIETFKGPLTLYLCSVTGDIFTAEDIMEETFVRLATKKPRFAGRCSFKTWLYTIAHNLAIDQLRREQKHPVTELEDDLADDELSSVEETYIKKEEKIAVHRALGKLNGEYRQVLWLAYFEELPNVEIGRIVGKSKRQVENLLYRAKQALKTELRKEGIGNEEH